MRLRADLPRQHGKLRQRTVIVGIGEDHRAAREGPPAHRKRGVGGAAAQSGTQRLAHQSHLPAIGPRNGEAERACRRRAGRDRRIGTQRRARACGAAFAHIQSAHLADRPCGRVVNLVRQVGGTALLLLGDEVGGQFHIAVEQAADQPRIGLAHRYGEIARRVAPAASARRAVHAADFDPLRHQPPPQCFGIPAPVGKVDHEPSAARAARIGAAAIGGIIGEEHVGILRHRFRRCQRGDEVVAHTLCIGERVAVAAVPHQPARATLFECHGDRAVQRGPRVAVSRIEGIEDFARVIGHAQPIEPCGVVAAQQALLRALVLRDIGIERIRAGREEIGAVAAHLVRIDQHHRLPFGHRRNLAARFGLGQREPVAIEIEQVMVIAPARPGLVVPGGVAITRRCDAELRVIGIGEPRPPIGVLAGVDDDHAFAQDRIDQRVPLRSEQVIGQHQRRVRSADLVPVHAVGQPGHRHAVRPRRAAIADALQIGANAIDARHVLAAGNHRIDERAAFPAARIFDQSHPLGRGFGQRFHVIDQHFGSGDLLARTVPRHLLQRRDRRVEIAFEQALRRSGPGGEGEGGSQCEQEADHAGLR